MKPHFNEKYPLAFRKKVIAYFKTHTARECAKKFGMDHMQVISLLETSRRKGLLSGKFKDTRRRDIWTNAEFIYLARCCGLIERGDIAQRLNRATARNIKERLQSFNSASKFLHGIPKSWAQTLFPNIAYEYIATKAGPNGVRGNFKFKIVPWVTLEKLTKKHELHKCVRTMATFQRFIWQTKSEKEIVNNLRGIINGKRSFKKDSRTIQHKKRCSKIGGIYG